MRRTAHYSRSPRTRLPDAGRGHAPRSGTGGEPTAPESHATTAAAPRRGLRARLGALARGRWAPLLAAAAVAALLALGLQALLRPSATPPTQADIDAAVRYSLENRPPEPSVAAQAYDRIRPSVVLVRRLREGPPASGPRDGGAGQRQGDAGRDGDSAEPAPPPESAPESAPAPQGESGKPTLTGVGTGVVFSEDGLIFTNLHVISGEDGIGVVFADGTESEVEVVDAQPENDLAVLKAKTLPDDLRPATLRSTRGLRTGDEVLAVGYPFGLGPTATWGVVSGLRRQHYSEQGRRNLVDLIQFDAAANPGNSGGPLVTRDGDVVGIVTSILNPTDESFFVGIGFAVPIENAAAAAGISPF
jgi:S1-C subfamily serine protease